MQSGMIHITFRSCLFGALITPISGCDMVRFSPWYGQYRMLKRCILHNGERTIKHKPLTFNTLHKPLISRKFASEEEPARKYALDFWGRTENSDGKTAGYWKSVSGPYCFHHKREKRYHLGIETTVYIETCPTVFCRIRNSCGHIRPHQNNNHRTTKAMKKKKP